MQLRPPLSAESKKGLPNPAIFANFLSMKNFYLAIIAGGSGTRLWPMSRRHLPKQLQKLVSPHRSLIQETYQRVVKIVPPENIYVVTVPAYLEATQAQLPQVSPNHFIVDPAPRDTAPAIGLLATYIYKQDSRAIISTTPADHVVADPKAYAEAVKKGLETIQKHPDYFLTVGIKPTFPDVNLGYIRLGSEFNRRDQTEPKVYKVKKFVEKPNLEQAKKYVASWQYLWNAAYFVFSAKHLLSSYRLHIPKTYRILRKIYKALGTPEESKVLKEEYPKCPKEPIDTAVIEKLKKVLVIPADIGWSDVGNWSTLHDVLAAQFGTSVISRGHHIDLGSKNCLIYANHKMVATVGLEDIIVVDTDDAILIVAKSKAAEIKKLVEKLKKEGKHLYL